MRRLKAFLFDVPTMQLWRYVLLAFPLAALPSIALSEAAEVLFSYMGVDVSLISAPEREMTLREVFGAVVDAPIAETILLAGTLWLLSRLGLRPSWIAAAAAILWGCLHATKGALWFFGTVWSFYIFACAYLVWRKVSFKLAFLAAALPHALVNATVMLALALSTMPNTPVTATAKTQDFSVSFGPKSAESPRLRY